MIYCGGDLSEKGKIATNPRKYIYIASIYVLYKYRFNICNA